MSFPIISLYEHPTMLDMMANWFSNKWSVPLVAYQESMRECIDGNIGVQWYVMMDEDKIIGGLGVIANDFHLRRDLTPNVCAVFVEPSYRNQGLAGELLNYVCLDMHNKGIDTLYLITDHTSFYEHYGWKYLCDVQENSGGFARMYIHQYKL